MSNLELTKKAKHLGKILFPRRLEDKKARGFYIRKDAVLWIKGKINKS